MIIGIHMKPGPGQGTPAIFYCGNNGAEFRKIHAGLVEKNTDGSRFYSIHHPMLVPMQSVAHSTEDHPDIVAAQKHREALVKKPAADVAPESVQVSFMNPETRRAELLTLKRAELLTLTERIKAAGMEITVEGKETKAQLVDLILASEGHAPAAAELPPEIQPES